MRELPYTIDTHTIEGDRALRAWLQELVGEVGMSFTGKVTSYEAVGTFNHTWDPLCVEYDVRVDAGGASGAVRAAAGQRGGGGGQGARNWLKGLKPFDLSVDAVVVVGDGGAAVTSAGASVDGLNGADSTFTDGPLVVTSNGGKAGIAIANQNGGAGGSPYHNFGNANGDTGTSAGSAGVDAQSSASSGAGAGRGVVPYTTFAGFVPGGFGRPVAGNQGAPGWNGHGGAATTADNQAGNDGIGFSSGGSGANRTAGNVSSGKGKQGNVVIYEKLST
jgi:hypothetical protein